MRNNFISGFLFIVVVLTPLLANAERYPHTVVYGKTDSDGNFYNISEYYGANIHYYISFNSHTLRVQNTTVTVTQEDVSNAIGHWQSGSRATFVQDQTNNQNHNILIQIANDSQQENLPGFTWFDSDRYTSNGQTVININSYWFENHAYRSYQNAISNQWINRQTSFAQYVQMIFRYTIAHEVGHALGLHHPDPRDRFAAQVVPGANFRPVPSIMLDSLEEYLRQHHLHAEGRGLIPSSNDFAAVNIMLRGGHALTRMRYFLQSCLIAVSRCIRHSEL